MERVPVSIGIPAIVRLQSDHTVTMVDRSRLFALRRVPIVIVGAFLVLANFVFLGTPRLASLNHSGGYALMSILCCTALTLPIFVIGRRARIHDMESDGRAIVYLHLWTACIAISALLAVAFSIASMV